MDLIQCGSDSITNKLLLSFKILLISKEGKKLLKSTDENIQNNIKNLLSPEDLVILERNTKKEAEKAMKQMAKFAAKNGISFPVK